MLISLSMQTKTDIAHLAAPPQATLHSHSRKPSIETSTVDQYKKSLKHISTSQCGSQFDSAVAIRCSTHEELHM